MHRRFFVFDGITVSYTEHKRSNGETGFPPDTPRPAARILMCRGRAEGVFFRFDFQKCAGWVRSAARACGGVTAGLVPLSCSAPVL